jgi:hypothetical protein
MTSKAFFQVPFDLVDPLRSCRDTHPSTSRETARIALAVACNLHEPGAVGSPIPVVRSSVRLLLCGSAQELLMPDLWVLALTFVSFAAAWGFVRLCDAI